MLRITGEWLDRVERQLAEVRAEIKQANQTKGQLVAEEAAHKQRLADADAAHKTKCAMRERELSNREAAPVEREREADAALKKAADRERMVEMRSADLSNRLHGIGAA